MNITGIVETQEGSYKVDVEMNSLQHRFIFETGLRFLIASGAVPIEVKEAHDVVIPEKESTH